MMTKAVVRAGAVSHMTKISYPVSPVSTPRVPFPLQNTFSCNEVHGDAKLTMGRNVIAVGHPGIAVPGSLSSEHFDDA